MAAALTPEDGERAPPAGPPGSAQGDDDAAPPPDYTDLLASFEEGDDLDDAEATELATGLSLREDSEEGVDTPDALLDIGDLLSQDEGEGSVEAAALDQDGPRGEGPDSDLIEIRDAQTIGTGSDADDGEGAIEPLSDLVDGDLPDLDDAAETGHAASPDAEFSGGGFLARELREGDDDLPRTSELPWVVLAALPPAEPRHVVARVGGRLLSTGRGLFHHSEDDATAVVVDTLPAKVSGLAAEPDGQTLLCATTRGTVFRIRVSGGSLEPLESWREAAPEAPPHPTIDVGGPTPSARPALLLLLAHEGLLLESTDLGTTFRRVDLGGRVLALSTGAPPLCVVESPRGLRAMRSQASGGFRPVAESWPVEAEGCRAAVDGDVIAVMAARSGECVHVSADGGATFLMAAGTRTATAIAAGRLGGRPCAFAALHAPASGRTTLVWIDATTGEALRIAELSGNEDDDDDSEPYRVSSLAWDPSTETLWAATPSGLFRFRRPASA